MLNNIHIENYRWMTISGLVSKKRWENVVPKYDPSRWACFDDFGWNMSWQHGQ